MLVLLIILSFGGAQYYPDLNPRYGFNRTNLFHRNTINGILMENSCCFTWQFVTDRNKLVIDVIALATSARPLAQNQLPVSLFHQVIQEQFSAPIFIKVSCSRFRFYTPSQKTNSAYFLDQKQLSPCVIIFSLIK